MVIVQVEGGLGNQLFQYALYQSFKSRGFKAKLDISKFDDYKLHNGYELEKIFGFKENYSNKTERAIIKSLSKLYHVISGHPYKEQASWQWEYQAAVNEISFGFLKGYWQSEKYFAGIVDTIRQCFIFPELKDERNKSMLEEMGQTQSVSLHIRRGDYIVEGRDCSLKMDYYNKAIALMNEKITDPVYFIFSDDIPWAKENIQVNKAHFIDWNKGDKSYVDMQLMSRCRHHIIANSSFSWWGAWLNANKEKNVIAPSPWMPGLKTDAAVLPKEWIHLPSGF